MAAAAPTRGPNLPPPPCWRVRSPGVLPSAPASGRGARRAARGGSAYPRGSRDHGVPEASLCRRDPEEPPSPGLLSSWGAALWFRAAAALDRWEGGGLGRDHSRGCGGWRHPPEELQASRLTERGVPGAAAPQRWVGGWALRVRSGRGGGGAVAPRGKSASAAATGRRCGVSTAPWGSHCVRAPDTAGRRSRRLPEDKRPMGTAC